MDYNAPRKSNNNIPKILAAVLGMLVMVGLCCGLCTMAAVGIDQEMTPQERDLFITPAKLGEALGANFGEREELITYSKNWSMGITTLEMEYDSPEEDIPLYLSHEITYEPSVKDARETVALGRVVLISGMKLIYGDEVQLVDANDLYTCCDESYSQVLRVPDDNGEMVDVGHLFIMRTGRVTMTLFYAGSATSYDPDLWRALLDPVFGAVVRARP